MNNGALRVVGDGSGFQQLAGNANFWHSLRGRTEYLPIHEWLKSMVNIHTWSIWDEYYAWYMNSTFCQGDDKYDRKHL